MRWPQARTFGPYLHGTKGALCSGTLSGCDTTGDTSPSAPLLTTCMWLVSPTPSPNPCSSGCTTTVAARAETALAGWSVKPRRTLARTRLRHSATRCGMPSRVLADRFGASAFARGSPKAGGIAPKGAPSSRDIHGIASCYSFLAPGVKLLHGLPSPDVGQETPLGTHTGHTPTGLVNDCATNVI